MKDLRRLMVVLGGTAGLATVAAVAAVGCGGDDTVVPADSGPDTTSDVSFDNNPPPPDVRNDIANDVGNDVTDGGGSDGDAAAEAADPAAFPGAVIKAWCQRLATCCQGADAAAFDFAGCFVTFSGIGGVNGEGLYYTVADLIKDGGGVVYDPAKANQCFADIAAFACGTNPSASYITLRDDCFAALKGTIAVGNPGCRGAIDCAPGGYCGPTGDGGTSCLGVAEAGAPCTSNDMCAYRGSDNPSDYCDIQFMSDAGTSTCLPRRGTGGACGDLFDFQLECQSEICNLNSQCDTSQIFSDPGTPGGLCDTLTIQDAGDGG